MYKMYKISKEAYKKCEIGIITKGKYFWINRRALDKESNYINQAQIVDKCNPKNKNRGKNYYLMQNFNDLELKNQKL